MKTITLLESPLAGPTLRNALASVLRQTRSLAIGIFILALFGRLIVLGLTFKGNDSVLYYDDAKIAVNLISGNGYSISYEYRNWLFYESILRNDQLRNPITGGTRTTAVKQPAYPLVLAGLFLCFGSKNFFVVFLFQAVLASLTATLLFLALTKRFPFLALVSALGMSLYPPMVFHSVTTPESTTLLLLIIAATWWCLAKMHESPSVRLWLVTGALAALAVLTEPVTVPFVTLCLVYGAWLDQRLFRTKFVNLTLAIGLAALLVSPWLIRNYLVFNRFPVFKSGLGLVFNWGLHFSGKGSWISDDTMIRLEENGRGLSELQEDEAIRRELRSGFPAHLREYVTYNIPWNFIHFWWDVKRYWNNYSFSYVLGRRIPYVILLLTSLPSLIMQVSRLLRAPQVCLRCSPVGVAALLLVVTYTLLYGIFGAFHSRYRLPVEMALLVFAGMTTGRLVERLSTKANNHSTPPRHAV